MNKIYICTGSCHGVATEEQYNNGATVCGAETCERRGQPLVPRMQCEASAAKGPKEVCENCKPLT